MRIPIPGLELCKKAPVLPTSKHRLAQGAPMRQPSNKKDCPSLELECPATPPSAVRRTTRIGDADRRLLKAR
jgi:hypothetical protein